jgi:transposase
VVERTISWLADCRRLHRRYERKADHFLAFVGIAAVLISYRRLDR